MNGGLKTNHGFMNPKSMTRQQLLAIPEVVGDEAYEHAIPTLNHGQTGYFTVGCEKSHNLHEQDGSTQYWAKGYIEFAFNHRGMIEDASCYFPLFFNFSEHVRKLNLPHRFYYLWELAGNHLREKDFGLDQAGFSAAVWLQTSFFDEKDQASQAWAEGWKLLVEYMRMYVQNVPDNAPFVFPATASDLA